MDIVKIQKLKKGKEITKKIFYYYFLIIKLNSLFKVFII